MSVLLFLLGLATGAALAGWAFWGREKALRARDEAQHETKWVERDKNDLRAQLARDDDEVKRLREVRDADVAEAKRLRDLLEEVVRTHPDVGAVYLDRVLAAGGGGLRPVEEPVPREAEAEPTEDRGDAFLGRLR